MSNFHEIEFQLSQLLMEASLSEEEKTEVQNFIDVGEYGIALETFVEIYFEEKKIASTEVIDLTRLLADRMSMDAITLMKRLTEG